MDRLTSPSHGKRIVQRDIRPSCVSHPSRQLRVGQLIVGVVDELHSQMHALFLKQHPGGPVCALVNLSTSTPHAPIPASGMRVCVQITRLMSAPKHAKACAQIRFRGRFLELVLDGLQIISPTQSLVIQADKRLRLLIDEIKPQIPLRTGAWRVSVHSPQLRTTDEELHDDLLQLVGDAVRFSALVKDATCGVLHIEGIPTLCLAESTPALQRGDAHPLPRRRHQSRSASLLSMTGDSLAEVHDVPAHRRTSLMHEPKYQRRQRRLTMSDAMSCKHQSYAVAEEDKINACEERHIEQKDALGSQLSCPDGCVERDIEMNPSECHGDNALPIRIHLACGAWLSLEKTEAMWVIDVNRGIARIADEIINIQAARMVGAYLEDENICGLVAIDFIGLLTHDQVQQVKREIILKKSDSAVITFDCALSLGVALIARGISHS